MEGIYRKSGAASVIQTIREGFERSPFDYDISDPDLVERHEDNLMTSQNVAVVFAPTIMRPESLAREMTDVQKKNDVLKFLVENCQEVFMGMQG